MDIPLLITGKIMRATAAHFHTCLVAKEKCKSLLLAVLGEERGGRHFETAVKHLPPSLPHSGSRI